MPEFALGGGSAFFYDQTNHAEYWRAHRNGSLNPPNSHPQPRWFHSRCGRCCRRDQVVYRCRGEGPFASFKEDTTWLCCRRPKATRDYLTIWAWVPRHNLGMRRHIGKTNIETLPIMVAKFAIQTRIETGFFFLKYNAGLYVYWHILVASICVLLHINWSNVLDDKIRLYLEGSSA